MNRIRRVLLLLLVAGLMPFLSACRVRTNGGGSGQFIPAAAGNNAQAGGAEDTAGTGAVSGETQEGGETDPQKNGETGTRTKENPDASRKEYDENAPVEILPGTGRLLYGEGEDNSAGAASDDAQAAGAFLNDQAEEPAYQTVAARETENKGVSEDADKADSAMTYFTVLLEDRGGSLYECQRVNLYWETTGDHVTVHKSSAAHSLILNAGAYDVSARLLPENLRVDDGWVVRKNPQVIVKVVDGSILGSTVSSPAAAKDVYRELSLREGWPGIDAVRNHQVLILSQELLDAPYLQTAAMLMIAKTANPELYADVDLQQALQMLAEEATGAVPYGIYYYSGE